MQSPTDNLFVKLDKAFDDEITLDGGKKLFKYTSLNPEWNVTTVGRVVSVPKKLSNRYELKGLEMEVQPEDEIIMSYMVVYSGDLRDRDSQTHNNLFRHNGEYFWKCDYYNYLGKIISGEVKAAQGYVYLEPIEEKKEERLGLIWVPESVVKEKPKRKARVVSVGKPKAGDNELSIKKSDIVYYPEKYACKYDILGKQYLILNTNQILAVE